MNDIKNYYDDKDFYKEYSDMRKTKLNANELLEMPTIKSMLDNINNKSILDLGCGAGDMDAYFINNGAKEVYAVDISQNMIKEAKERNGLKGIIYDIMPLEEIDKINKKFDIVYSSLAFHYIQDFDKLINDISNLLNENGLLVFSQEHPIVTATILKSGSPKYIEFQNKRYYYLSDYNNQSVRHSKVAGSILLTKYHRNFSKIMNTLITNNLSIQEVRESEASEEVIKQVEKYQYQKDRPYFLFIKAKKESK